MSSAHVGVVVDHQARCGVFKAPPSTDAMASSSAATSKRFFCRYRVPLLIEADGPVVAPCRDRTKRSPPSAVFDRGSAGRSRRH